MSTTAMDMSLGEGTTGNNNYTPKSSHEPNTTTAMNLGDAQSSAAAILTYNNIRVNGFGDLGQFRTMKEKFGWRLRKPVQGVDPNTKKMLLFEGTNVESAMWICYFGKDYQLKVFMNDGEVLRFDGFKESDFEPLSKHLRQHWKIELGKEKLATKGWHWGMGQVSTKRFRFDVDGKSAFDVSSKRISQVTASKGDVAILLDNEEARADVEDQLLELRLFIPPSKNGDEEGLEAMRQALTQLPGSRSTPSLQAICSFSDLKVLIPAGRFDIQVSRRSMKLLGKSSDFTVDFSMVTRMFLLPSPTSPHANLVLSLSTPLRKGHTPYHNIIVQFDSKRVVEITLAISDQEIKEIEETNPREFKTDLSLNMSGNEYEIATRLLKALSGKPITEPNDFRSSTGQCCFRSSYKADSGNFYPLDTCFVFIPKPVIIIGYDDIVSVTFGRTSGSQTKLFEFDVAVKGGQTYSFSSVDRQESANFIDFLNNKNIRVRSFTLDDNNESATQLDQGLPLEDESDDEDFDEDDSLDGEDDDDDDDDTSSADENEELDDEEAEKNHGNDGSSPDNNKEHHQKKKKK